MTLRLKTQPKQQKRRSGWAYVFQGVGTNWFKIGCSKHPLVRAKQLDGTHPFPVVVVCVIQTDDIYRLERMLHARYWHLKIRKEWFALGEAEIAEMKTMKQVIFGTRKRRG